MHDQNHYWTERALAFAVSAGMHLALIVVVLGMTKQPLEPMPENIKVELANLSIPATPEPPTPEPPTPEPPTPEPPAPEPPAPEPPAPEPPAPEPPKPEPPKPEPPKPEPPKPPVPKPQVITTPAPTPKPTPKPPAPTPKPAPRPPTPIKSLKERLKEAEVKKQTGRPSPRPASRNVPSQEELKKKLIRAAGPSTYGPTASSSASSSVHAPYTAQQIRESSNYAEKVVGPYLYQRWEQPTRSELGAAPVRPVEVSFTVYANGAIANVVIAGDNNNQALVRSIRNLFADIRSMPPLSTVGSNAASLRIIVVMTLTSN